MENHRCQQAFPGILHPASFSHSWWGKHCSAALSHNCFGSVHNVKNNAGSYYDNNAQPIEKHYQRFQAHLGVNHREGHWICPVICHCSGNAATACLQGSGITSSCTIRAQNCLLTANISLLRPQFTSYTDIVQH